MQQLNLITGKPENETIKDAFISAGGKYRYWLSRIWDQRSINFVGWIMLNPSTADHKEDDPTIKRCIEFSKSWGFAGMYVVNLFAYRATDPVELTKVDDPVGPYNNFHTIIMLSGCKLNIAAWGNNGNYLERDKEILKIIPDLHCLKVTNQNQPSHPLYLKSDLKPKPFSAYPVRKLKSGNREDE